MKRERKLVDDRQNEIMELVKKNKKVMVDQLAEQFKTSSMTIRRDLQYMEEQGLVKRFYGGAEIVEKEKKEQEDSGILWNRRCLARYAASLIEDGDTILINGSSTAMMIAEELGEKNVRIITNNVNCLNVNKKKNITFSLTGGDYAINNLLQVKADKAFLGFAGISDNGDVICDVSREIGVHQIMMNHSSKFYIILDHQKIGNVVEGPICSLEAGGELITDNLASPEILLKLNKKGIKITTIAISQEQQ